MWPETERRTFDILHAPDGSIQSTGILVPTAALIITYGVYVQSAERTGSNPNLTLGFRIAAGDWYTRTVMNAAQMGSGHSTLSFFSLAAGPPAASGELVYQAGSPDWTDFRGQVYIIWTRVL